MKILTFLGRFFSIWGAVIGAGMLGTCIFGWRSLFPISRVWSISSSIGGFIASSVYGAKITSIIIVSFTWPLVLWLPLGLVTGVAVAGFEFGSQRKSET